MAMSMTDFVTGAGILIACGLHAMPAHIPKVSPSQ
jgi:hypothetical protein